jgi:hypothetical protein
LKYTKIKAYRTATLKRLEALKPFAMKEKAKNAPRPKQIKKVSHPAKNKSKTPTRKSTGPVPAVTPLSQEVPK